MAEKKVFTEALKKFSPELTTLLHGSADNREWPKELSDELSIGIEDEDLILNYGNADPDTVINTEYGYLDKKPAPAIRDFINTADTAIGTHLENVAFAEMKTRGVL